MWGLRQQIDELRREVAILHAIIYEIAETATEENVSKLAKKALEDAHRRNLEKYYT